MIGRTHDLAAFAALSYVVANQPVPQLTLATAIVALSSNFVGGLFPDIDQPTGNLWHRIPAGSIFGKMISPLLGGHRYVTHSILGFVLTGYGLRYLLGIVGHTLLVNMDVVWWAFMIGYMSHLVMDTLTHEGVPWFFPLGWKIGFPPLKILRVKTGGFVEKFIVFPTLLAITGYIYYMNYDKFLTILKYYLNR